MSHASSDYSLYRYSPWDAVQLYSTKYDIMDKPVQSGRWRIRNWKISHWTNQKLDDWTEVSILFCRAQLYYFSRWISIKWRIAGIRQIRNKTASNVSKLIYIRFSLLVDRMTSLLKWIIEEKEHLFQNNTWFLSVYIIRFVQGSRALLEIYLLS